MKSQKIMQVLIAGFIAMCFTLTVDAQKKPWVVPDGAKSKKNPVASDAASIATGKTLWVTHCKSCHGAKGLGDGTKAAELKTEPGNFTKSDIQSQSDGS